MTVARDSVNIASDQTQNSTILAAGTDFTFDEPVFLQPWTEYAIVLSTTSNQYEVYVGEAGQYVIGSTSRTFSAESAWVSCSYHRLRSMRKVQRIRT